VLAYSRSVTAIDPAHFRQTLGHFPTGVTIVTGLDASGAPQGLTIGSFTSVSLDPALVGFLPGRSSVSWDAIAPTGAFCVNILAADQAELCWKFARESDGRFDGIEWTAAASGSPILPGVVGWIDCTVESTYDMGDHWFVLGAVNELIHHDADDAMVFFRGKVGGFQRSA
jgi:3-hydroxy-9,10-secoandrosta-1,3,5(10)-triene-9,17-dione monooxygenase reductase component